MAEKNLVNHVMYHFTKRAGWKGVNEGNPDYCCKDPRTGEYIDGERIRGLWPHRRLIPLGPESSLVPSEATQPAVFGLPEEKPQSWIQYEDCDNIFDYLMRHCAEHSDNEGRRALVLLKVELKPEDNPFVVECLHMRNLSRTLSTESDIRNKLKLIAEGHKRYWESRVPLADYKGNFTLPEIIVWTPIPQERVHFVWEKDLYQFLDEAHGSS